MIGHHRAMLPDHLALLDALARQIAAIPADRHLALVLVHRPCVQRVDALLGLRHGDAVAAQGAQAVGGVLKPGDGVWRLDRATLACVLSSLEYPAQAWSAAHRLVQCLSEPVEVGGHMIHATASAGFALFPAHAGNADELVQRATLALEAAPRAGDRVAVYDPQQHAGGQDELALQAALQRAIADQKLDLRFQPQLRLADGAIVACEALSRWQDAALGPVSPAVFVPALETAGWMPRLTHWLLHASLRQISALPVPIAVAVNLSAQDLAASDLAALVEQALATWNVAPARLVVEITETAVMADDATVEANVLALRRLGVRLSLDDFGTGHSSLTRLRRLPIGEIKIDVAFVKRLLDSPEDRHIVRSLIGLAHGLDLTVVAEGVEDGATLSWLAEAGCDLAQGYHIAPPLSAAELAAFLATRGQAGPA